MSRSSRNLPPLPLALALFSEAACAVEAGGYLQFDRFDPTPDHTPMASGAETRRARAWLEGGQGAFAWQAEIDFTDTHEHPSWRDLWIAWRQPDGSQLQVGSFKEPFFLDELTSSRNATFVERGLPDLFAPGRNAGAAWRHVGTGYTLTGGLFGEEVNAGQWTGSHAAAVRATWAPVAAEQRAVHLGVALNRRETGSEETRRFRARPEAHLAPQLVDTGSIKGVAAADLLGLEAAWVEGPWSLQAEYVAANVERAGPDPVLSGHYLFGSWFLTGESRVYRPQTGTFGPIKPTGPYGALELAVRVSGVDLTDAGIAGGRQTDLTVGLNWYANRNVRFLADYIQVDAHPNSKGHNDAPRLWLLRTQFSL